MIFDNNVPVGLRNKLPHHEVWTARQLGWAALKNGILLAKAEAANFEVMITGDKNIAYQQNLAGRKLSLVVLQNPDWRVLQHCCDLVLAAVERAVPGSFEQL